MRFAGLGIVFGWVLPLLPAAAATVADKAAAVAPRAATPPSGRYRCYQPPNYSVTAWFDLHADQTYSVQGSAAGSYDWEGSRSLLRWRGGDFAQGRAHGIYMPPGSKHGDQERATIVLLPRDGIRQGSAGWERLQRCYLTTH